MSYGLDFTEVRYETDHAGNRLKATIPYAMFSALTEFWVAARRAQTARLEATARPGQFKGSLQAAQLRDPEVPDAPPDKPAPRNANDRHWQSLIASLPAEQPPPADSQPASFPPAVTPPTNHEARRVFYREFIEAPPSEVIERIAAGIYFTRAWREYRGLTIDDAADLFGRNKTTIIWHESGKAVPSRATLERFAHIYDCSLAQVTPKPGSDHSPFDSATDAQPVAETLGASDESRKPARTMREPRAPVSTDYPECVLAHMTAGKSPLLAWRLYRGMTVKTLAEAYGTTGSNMTAMERNVWLRRATIEKLCPIFHCKPEQLLRPEGMASARDAIQDTAEAVASPAAFINGNAEAKRNTKVPGSTSAMEAAFLLAGVIDGRSHRDSKEKELARDGRLARMQAEMARL